VGGSHAGLQTDLLARMIIESREREEYLEGGGAY